MGMNGDLDICIFESDVDNNPESLKFIGNWCSAERYWEFKSDVLNIPARFLYPNDHPFDWWEPPTRSKAGYVIWNYPKNSVIWHDVRKNTHVYYHGYPEGGWPVTDDPDWDVKEYYTITKEQLDTNSNFIYRQLHDETEDVDEEDEYDFGTVPSEHLCPLAIRNKMDTIMHELSSDKRKEKMKENIQPWGCFYTF